VPNTIRWYAFLLAGEGGSADGLSGPGARRVAAAFFFAAAAFFFAAAAFSSRQPWYW